jgi:hypothetical protein
MDPLTPPPSLQEVLGGVFAASGVDPRAWALGLSRSAPAVTLVPAFGLTAVPVQVRLALGLALGLCIAPALSSRVPSDGSLLLAMGREALLGLPVALLAALSIYVASMVGGLIDDLRGARENMTLPTLPRRSRRRCSRPAFRGRRWFPPSRRPSVWRSRSLRRWSWPRWCSKQRAP